MEGSGIEGGIDAAENCSCLNSSKLSPAAVVITTDFRNSSSRNNSKAIEIFIRARDPGEHDGSSRPKTVGPRDVYRAGVPNWCKLTSKRKVGEECIVRRREGQTGEGTALYRCYRRKTRPGIDIPDRCDCNIRTRVTADRPGEGVHILDR